VKLFPVTIADLYDLYDPDNMPENLRRAHDRNDEVLERIYIGRRFKNDTERLEKLFELYTKMTAGVGRVLTRFLLDEYIAANILGNILVQVNYKE